MPAAHLRFAGMIGRREFFGLVFRVILDHHLEGLENRQGPRGVFVEVVADAEFEQGHIDGGIPFGNADPLAEVTNGRRRVASATQPGDGQHSRIIPAPDMAFLHQSDEFALAHHRIVQIEAGKLDLLGVEDLQLIEDPVVQRPMVLEFQGAEGVGNPLDGVREAVGVIVHGIYAPHVSGTVVMGSHDPIDHRITHIDVAAGHVDFGPQRPGNRPEIHQPACVERGPGCLRWFGCDMGSRGRVRSGCRATL